jgi:hypothetical protein
VVTQHAVIIVDTQNSFSSRAVGHQLITPHITNDRGCTRLKLFNCEHFLSHLLCKLALVKELLRSMCVGPTLVSPYNCVANSGKDNGSQSPAESADGARHLDDRTGGGT